MKTAQHYKNVRLLLLGTRKGMVEKDMFSPFLQSFLKFLCFLSP